jgi:K+-sensing histidine kinase KdpD
MSSPADTVKSDQTPDIPWNDVVCFVRQLNHDLRNHLNAVELQSTYLGELAEEPELKSEIKHLREMMSDLGVVLQRLSAVLGQPNLQLMSYHAADFIEDLRQKISSELPKESASIEWSTQLGEEMLQIDPQLLQEAVMELFMNARQHNRGEGKLSFVAKTEADHLVLTLHEPKKTFDLPTENWGQQPLHKIGRGHYGLGLHRARVIIEAHESQLKAHYDSANSMLITTITLPLFKDAG